MNEEEIFQTAAALPSAERAAYLATACEGQAALRQRVERLLASHDDGGFMQRPADRTDSAELQAELARLKPEEDEDRIGNFKLLQKLGEGGFGTVWMAEQLEPVRRRVALKIIKPGMDSTEVLVRFEQERKALALMDHPNIAKVLDAGVTPLRRPFFVMDLVRGIRITDFCDQNNLPTRERLALFIAVCNAIQHAHQKGIIHRDIKPSNILVTLHDGVPVPKVIDFGVAKAIQSQRLTDLTFFTRFEQMIGTPLYMSPEQAEMSGLDIDTRSDIYSLGVLLYELLTGTTPFDAKELMALGIDAMRKTIRETEPVRPSTKLSQTLVAAEMVGRVTPCAPPVGVLLTLEDGARGARRHSSKSEAEVRASSRRLLRIKETIALLRGDLDWIVMKCLEKDRTRRYDTANGLAMDIQRHMNSEPILARAPTATYKLRKFIRRNRSAVMAAAALLLVLCLGLVGTTVGLVWADREAGRARLAELDATGQRDDAFAARERAAQLLYASDMDRAQRAWEDNNVGLVLELLERHRARKRPGDFEWYYLWRLCKRSRLIPAIETPSPALAVALSPDGKTVACGGMDGQVVLIDATTHLMRKLGAHSSQVLSIAFSPDGKRLASGSGDRTVRLWDVGTGQHQPITEFTDWVESVAFSPDGSRLVVGSLDGQVGLWNVAAQKFEWRSEDARYVYAVAFSPGGTIVASASEGSPGSAVPPGVKLRDAVTGQVRDHLVADDLKAGVISFSPDGGSLATTGHDGIIRLWNLELKEPPRELKGHSSGIHSLVYLDSDTLASGSSDNTVRLWDLATGKLRDTLKGHSGAVRAVACSTDGKLLISASSDHTVKLWQLNWQHERTVLEQHEGGVWSVALSPVGSNVASGSWDGTVKLWDAATGELKFDLRGHSDCVTCVAFSPDGKTLASSGDDRTIVLWDTATGEVRRRLTGHADTVWSLAFLEGGLTLASAGEDRTVRLWSVATGEGRTLVKGSNKISCLSVWQDQMLVFGGWDDYVIEVWDLHGRGHLPALRGHLGPVKAVAVMSSGRKLITGSWDGTVRLWDLESDGRSEILTRHTDYIYAVAVSPDGNTLASSGMDGTVNLLDLTTRRERAALKGHTGSVLSLAFSGDGKLLVSGGEDRTVRLWRAASEEEAVGASVSPMPLR